MRLLVLLLAAGPLSVADEVTVYDLLAPSTHSLDTIYDVSATRPGAAYFCNPIRPGSVASKERVVGRHVRLRRSVPERRRPSVE